MYDTQPWSRHDTGRHAIDEDAVLTPIFAALARGGWRQRESAEAERFHRDPLTAPLPVESPSSGIAPAGHVPAQEGGRHHVRRIRPVLSSVTS